MGRRTRAVARGCRALLLLGLVAAVLGVGTPALGRPSTTAQSAPAATTFPAPPTLVLPDAVAQLRPTVPAGYRPPATPTPTAAAKTTRPAASQPATRSATGSTAPRTTAPRTTAPRPPATPATPAAPAATGAVLPLTVSTGSSTQLVTVVASSPGATTAKLTAWQKGPNGWTATLGPVTARIGAQGVGRASETTSRTPAGTFTLTEGFGRLGNPGTRLSYRSITGKDYWVSDTASPLYNTFQQCAPGTCPFDTAAGERLWDAGSSYDYAVVIDYNRRPAVRGAGSAFFLHVTNGAPTAGCVAIGRGSLRTIMRWLDPAARPLIAIGVG